MKRPMIAMLVTAAACLASPLAHAGNDAEGAARHDAAAASGATPATGTYYLHVSNDLVGSASADFRRELSTVTPAPPPAEPQEPVRYGMMLAGLGVLGIAARRRKTARRA